MNGVDVKGSRGPAGSSWLWLLLAGGLWFSAGGRYAVRVAAWLAPAFMLRWLRGRRVAVGFPLAVLAPGAVNYFAWRLGTNWKRK